VFSRLARIGDWPIATKVVALSVGVAVALTIMLTTISFLQAAAGLREQADAALRSEAQLTVSAADAWNAERINQLKTLGGLPEVQQILQDGPDAHPEAVAFVQAVVASMRANDPDVEVLNIMDTTGNTILSNNPRSRDVSETMMTISATVEEASAATEEMTASAEGVGRSIQTIATVSEENSASAEEISASAEQMSAQVEEMSGQAEELASGADHLRELVEQFRLEEDVVEEEIPHHRPQGLRRAS
jgi:hypothetical protein